MWLGRISPSRSDVYPSQTRKIEARPGHAVGGQDARPARVGHDGQARTLGQRLRAEHARQVEQGREVVDLDDAGLLEGRLIGALGTGQGADMGRNCLAAVLGHARLKHDDGLLAGDGLADSREAAAVVHAFEIADDHMGLRVLGQELEHGRLVDDGPVAEARELGEPDLLAGGPVKDGVAHGARGREEGDVALGGQAGDEGRVHAVGPGGHAEAVGPQERHVPALGQLDDRLFEVVALAADLAEPRRGDDDRADAFVGDAFQGVEDGLGRQADHGQIDVPEGLQGVGRALAGPIDGHDPPLIPGAFEIGQDHTGRSPRAVEGADDRDGLGRKQGVKINVSHGEP